MSLSTLPPWLQVGTVVESGTARYTITSITEDKKAAVLRSHANDAEARFGVDLIARNYKPCLGVLGWMRVGVNLTLKDVPENQVTIVAVQGDTVQVRDIDATTGFILPTGTIRSFTTIDLERLFDPVAFTLPRWFDVGSRIVLREQDQTYEVRSIDRYAGSFTAFQPSSPTRLERFNLRDFESFWRPYRTVSPSDLREDTPSKKRRPLVPAVIPNSAIPTAPDWLRPGSFLRPYNRHMRHSFWVMSIHPDRGMCRIQRVLKFAPIQIAPEWEELAYETAEKDWEPINEDGSPVSERKCPRCGVYGGRHKEAEQGSAYQVRIYHCSEGHRWSFIDGGNDDGKPAPPTRFERELDL